MSLLLYQPLPKRSTPRVISRLARLAVLPNGERRYVHRLNQQRVPHSSHSIPPAIGFSPPPRQFFPRPRFPPQSVPHFSHMKQSTDSLIRQATRSHFCSVHVRFSLFLRTSSPVPRL